MLKTLFFCVCLVLWSVNAQKLPVVINTWAFVDANEAAMAALNKGASSLDAVELGCTAAEMNESIKSVGYGGSPDELGETTLDAMIMDGETHDVGSVGCLKNIKNAIGVARNVMERTQETLLVGDDATAFAVAMGFQVESLTTDYSRDLHEKWVENKCQPNYWKQGTVSPDPTASCGPYAPAKQEETPPNMSAAHGKPPIDKNNHDTIGMIVINAQEKIACGTTTNGLANKIAGRVGDSPITGAGCYVEKGVGGAVATGDGDVMMRFLPTYQVVQNMAAGMSPTAAAQATLAKISAFYPDFGGALVAVSVTGEFGAAFVNFDSFPYTVVNPDLGNSTVFNV